MIDLCACLHSGSVWPFSCKGKSQQVSCGKHATGVVLLTVICSAGCGFFPFMFGDLLDE